MTVRPTKTTVSSGNQNWDASVDGNDDIILNGPFPAAEHTGDETDLASTYSPGSFTNCLIWVEHSGLNKWILYWSDGSNWKPFGAEVQNERVMTGTITQTQNDQIVRATSTGTYNFLPVSVWAGGSVTVMNRSGGNVTLDGDASEQIEGGLTLILADGENAQVYNNGTALYAIVS